MKLIKTLLVMAAAYFTVSRHSQGARMAWCTGLVIVTILVTASTM